MRWQATMKVAVRRLTLCSLRHLPDAREGLLHDAHQAGVDLVFAPEEAGEVLPHSSSSPSRRRRWRSRRAAPARPLSFRMSSASVVVGPLAPSITNLALIWPALSLVIWPSSAAGIRISQSTPQNSSAFITSAPAKPPTPPRVFTCASSAGTSRPLLLKMVPVWSCTATTLAPASANSFTQCRPRCQSPARPHGHRPAPGRSAWQLPHPR